MSPKQERHCLVTVGATAGFKSLIKTVLLPEFWKYLASRGFTSLHIQCGPDQPFAAETIKAKENQIPAGLTIKSFELCKDLLNEEMMLCKPGPNRKQGVIISHAGTGTILDAWRISVPMIIIPNTDLLDDHQTELAEHLADNGYATMSNTELSNIKESIIISERLASGGDESWHKNFGSVNTGLTARLWQINPRDPARPSETDFSDREYFATSYIG